MAEKTQTDGSMYAPKKPVEIFRGTVECIDKDSNWSEVMISQHTDTLTSVWIEAELEIDKTYTMVLLEDA